MTKAITDSNKETPSLHITESDASVVYQVASQHWTHSEQVRWTSLYNFLMATTILFLAWGAVFAGDEGRPYRKCALLVFSLAALFLALLWFGLALRANRFVHFYATLGRALEPESLAGSVPFRASEVFRYSQGGGIRSRHVLLAVPAIFGLVSIALVFISWFGA